MDVLTLLDKLDDLIYEAKPIPMTDQVRVPREDVYGLLDQIRMTLPDEVKQARWILEEREEMRADDVPSDELKAIAESIEDLKRSQERTGPPPLTAAASEKVRAIIQAAEASAAEIREEAEREARRIESEAARGAVEARKRSAAEAAARLKRADDVTRALLEEAGSASASIEALLDRVRAPAAALADALVDGNTHLRADLDRMRARIAEESGDEHTEESGGDRTEATGQTGDTAWRSLAAEAVRRQTVSQPTEEWDGIEAVSAAGGAEAEEADEGFVAAEDDYDSIRHSLPGPDDQVSATRIGRDDSEGDGSSETGKAQRAADPEATAPGS